MGRILHLKITLMRSNPLICRKVQVTESCRIDRFHQVIQIVMGWENAHLHEFRFQDRKIGMLLDDDLDLPEVEDETELYLSDLSLGKGDAFAYLYDFGDSWEHIVDLENISDGALPHFFCTNGERACPLKTVVVCGGMRKCWRRSKTHPTHSTRIWRSGFPMILTPTDFPGSRSMMN